MNNEKSIKSSQPSLHTPPVLEQAHGPGKKYENPKVRKNIFGRKYWVPIIEKIGDPLKETQPELFAVLERIYAQEKGAFIDVGVNVGQTLTKIFSISPDIPYFGFEANVYACFYVRQFLAMNRDMQDCVVIPIGLSDRPRLARLYRKGLAGAGASIIDEHRESHQSFKHKDPVFAIPGDGVIDAFELSKITAVKVDVEGGELEVLKGLGKTLQKHQPFVICEGKPVFDCRTNEGERNSQLRLKRQQELEVLMDNLGYSICKIEFDGSLLSVPSMSVDEKVTRDYLFVPSGKQSVL